MAQARRFPAALPPSGGRRRRAVDCEVTKAYYRDTNADHWALIKERRLRSGPLRRRTCQRLLCLSGPAALVRLAYANGQPSRPTWTTARVIGARRIYYHAGLDIGGAERMVDVLAATSGLVVGLEPLVDREKDNAQLHTEHNDTFGYG